MTIQELIGKNLSGFQIIKMAEVYRVDDDGRKTKSLGFFRDPDIAEAYAGAQPDARWHKTEEAVVLTDGSVGYVLEEQDPANIFDDEMIASELKEQILDKLTPAERKLFGLK